MPKSVTGERIELRLGELGISQAELARRCKLAQSTINGLINGSSRSSAHLHVIARQLGVSTAWLAGVRAASDRGIEGEGAGEQSLEALGLVLVPAVSLSEYVDGDLSVLPVIAQVPIARAWVHDWLESKDKGLVYVTRAESDEMAPTISRGDMCLLDAGDVQIRSQDSVWAVCMGGVAMIRRVRRLGDDRLELRSDNANVAPIETTVGEVKVLGHVSAVMRRI